MLMVNGDVQKREFFPDGTMRLSLDTEALRERDVIIRWHYEEELEMTHLFYIVSHIRSINEDVYIELVMPYIPNARMDRVKNPDEIFTLKYFCKFINDLHFNTVFVCDPHSSVAIALLDRVEFTDITQNIWRAIHVALWNPEDIVFFPDEGAMKRYSDLVRVPYAFGIKKRDWQTGKIQGLEVSGPIPTDPFNVLIIDDICSYGGTFLHSAKKLKELGAKKISLYVTHCENTILKGELINSGLIEEILTTDSIFTGEHPLIRKI